MPHAEHGAGHGGQRHGCEVHGGKRGCQAGVLHAHLDGQRAHLRLRQAERAAHEIAQRVTADVVQHDHHDDQRADGRQLGGVGGHHGHDDQRDGDDGDERQHLGAGLGHLGRNGVDDEAQRDGNEHHLHDGQQHADIADVDALAGEQQHERRGDDRGHDGGARGHADGQRHVALGQVRHDVGGGAAGAAADEHDAHGKLGGQLEDQAQHPGDQRHDDELGQDAGDHGLRLGEHHLEIAELERHAHAEHDDAEQRVDPAGGQRRMHGRGRDEGDDGDRKRDDGHPFAGEVADLLEDLHDEPF